MSCKETLKGLGNYAIAPGIVGLLYGITGYLSFGAIEESVLFSIIGTLMGAILNEVGMEKYE